MSCFYHKRHYCFTYQLNCLNKTNPPPRSLHSMIKHHLRINSRLAWLLPRELQKVIKRFSVARKNSLNSVKLYLLNRHQCSKQKCILSSTNLTVIHSIVSNISLNLFCTSPLTLFLGSRITCSFYNFIYTFR